MNRMCVSIDVMREATNINCSFQSDPPKISLEQIEWSDEGCVVKMMKDIKYSLEISFLFQINFFFVFHIIYKSDDKITRIVQ